MYIFKNALKNLGRNKGRNILLGIIIFALILATTVSLVIHSTTNEIIDDYKTRFGSKVTLSVDFEKLMSETTPDSNGSFAFPSAPEISPEQYLSFSKSDYLKSFMIDSSAGIVFHDLKAVDEKEDNGGIVGSIGSEEEYVSPKAKLMGFSDSNNLPDFSNGLRKIIDGSLYEEENECLISSDFANLNKLKVGDEFLIRDTSGKNDITLTISGIYADATKANDDLPEGSISLSGSYGNRRNEILVHMDTMTKNFEVSSLIVNAEYELKSPELVEDFEKELREKGLSTSYNVETDEASYNKIVAPVIGLSKISMTFMWVILAVGGIILLFVTSMAIRERKYEIGVLRAMGMKKAKVALMLAAEIIMITAVCLGVGLGVGNAAAQPVADTLIAGQVEAAENAQNNSGINGGNISGGVVTIGGDSDNETKPLSEIDVSLTPDAALQITLIALGLALLSSVVGVIFITKYEPMKILSERN